MSQAKEVFMLLQWFLVHIKTGRNRWLTLKNAFVCHLLKCKLPVPSLDLSVIGVFIHFNRGYCNVGVRWGFFFLFFFERIWLRFYLLRAIVNIPIQALIISPRLLFRKMIISKLELGCLWSYPENYTTECNWSISWEMARHYTSATLYTSW